MYIIQDFGDAFFGDISTTIDLLNDLDYEQRYAYVRQFVEFLPQVITDQSNLNLPEITSTILTYPNEKIAEFIRDSKNYMSFVHSASATRRMNIVMKKIRAYNGNLSVYNAFATSMLPENFSHDAISASISQTLKLLYTYKFVLTQEALKKLDPSNSFAKDKEFLEIVNNIKQSQKNTFSDEDVIRIIRNGIAHCNYKDSSQLTECMNITDLEQNMQMKIFNQAKDKYLFLDFTSVMALMNFANSHLNKIIKVNFAKYTPILDSITSNGVEAMAVKKIYDDVVSNNNLQRYELDCLKKLQSKAPNFAFSISGLLHYLIALDFPEYSTTQDINRAIDVAKSLNRGRNKQQKKNLDNIELSVPTLITARMFDILTTLKDLDLTKDFVKDNMDCEYLKKIPLFKMDQNPKKKSVVNKLRLLRNCLAHSFMFDYGESFQAFDIDEKKTKIDLGEINYMDLTMLCETMENYILNHHRQTIAQNPILTTKYVM